MGKENQPGAAAELFCGTTNMKQGLNAISEMRIED